MADENTQQTESERNLTKLLAKKDGDSMALAADLLTENAQLRADKRTLNGQLTELQDKVPAEGTRVLSKSEAERLAAFEEIKLKPDEIKTRLEAGQKAAKAVAVQGNRDALTTLGLKPSAVRLAEFNGVSVSAVKDGDGVKATVKEGDAETPWEQWVKDKGLESDLKDFGLTETVTVVPALGQVGGGETPNTDTWSQAANSRFGVTKKE